MTDTITPPTRCYLSVRDVATRYSIGISTIWDQVAAGRMPRPMHLTPRTTRWAIDDLEAWEADCRAARSRPAATQ